MAGELQRHRDKVALQTQGAEKLLGACPYALARSVKALHLNRFLHAMVQPAHREAFQSDPETAFEQATLTDEERELLRRRNWRGLIPYGAIFFVLEKLGALVGVSNLHICAAMKGLPLEAFLRARNAPGALYSVATVPADASQRPAVAGERCYKLTIQYMPECYS